MISKYQRLQFKEWATSPRVRQTRKVLVLLGLQIFKPLSSYHLRHGVEWTSSMHLFDIVMRSFAQLLAVAVCTIPIAIISHYFPGSVTLIPVIPGLIALAAASLFSILVVFIYKAASLLTDSFLDIRDWWND